ncbi:hypothetical protein Ancab_026380 [Ancistrocladus abbreviatus]
MGEVYDANEELSMRSDASISDGSISQPSTYTAFFDACIRQRVTEALIDCCEGNINLGIGSLKGIVKFSLIV